MQTGLDSAYPPNSAQATAAKAAGYSAWLGYFAGPNILNGWTKGNFDLVKAAGLSTAAYCSGWADPAAMASQSAAWGVPIILDDEGGIRSAVFGAAVTSANRRLAHRMYGDKGVRSVYEMVGGVLKLSAWVPPWLNTSGAGLYGNMPVFAGAHAATYVFAAYPGSDPGAAWPPYYPRPGDGHPCGWQFQGTHSLWGIGVDTTHFDDSFFGLHGGGGGVVPQGGDEEMLYVGAFKALAGTFKTFAPAGIYADPSPAALQVGAVGTGAAIAVKGFLFSNAGVQSSDRGAGAGPGIDLVWWQRTDGTWIPDADLITTGVAGAPIGAALSAMPAGARPYFARESELAGITGGSGLTADEVNALIASAVSKIPAPPAVPTQVVIPSQTVKLS